MECSSRDVSMAERDACCCLLNNVFAFASILVVNSCNLCYSVLFSTPLPQCKKRVDLLVVQLFLS